jgi:hypothetical protein
LLSLRINEDKMLFGNGRNRGQLKASEKIE